jgi:LysM repeat protein
MKRLIIFILVSLPLALFAQKTHTVAAKESWYSIGRMYNIHPRDLATYNNSSLDKGLSIGQVVKIPSAGNAAPMPDIPAASASVPQPAATPLYHTVAPKEGLYSISKKYNVSVADIKKWNNLSGDALTIGMKLQVTPGNGAIASTPVVTAPVVKPAPVVVKTETPVMPSATETAEPRAKQAVVERSNINFNGGVFKSAYTQQVGNKNVITDKGVAGVFKSTSGWDDGKYYCLHNSAPAGSYIKITNTANNKVVYAKVLDLIPDLKQNEGIIIRISNAAATELGTNGSANFDCTLQY